jgi:hypothetical protein
VFSLTKKPVPPTPAEAVDRCYRAIWAAIGEAEPIAGKAALLTLLSQIIEAEKYADVMCAPHAS